MNKKNYFFLCLGIIIGFISMTIIFYKIENLEKERMLAERECFREIVGQSLKNSLIVGETL